MRKKEILIISDFLSRNFDVTFLTAIMVIVIKVITK